MRLIENKFDRKSIFILTGKKNIAIGYDELHDVIVYSTLGDVLIRSSEQNLTQSKSEEKAASTTHVEADNEKSGNS